MRTYEYKAYNQHGQTRKGLIEALSEKDAREKLAAQALYPVTLHEAGRHRTTPRRRRSRNGPAERGQIYRELAILLHAGLSLSNALHLLTETPELLHQRSTLAHIHDAVRQGRSLAHALETAAFARPLETALVHIGERTGALDQALARLADHLEEQLRLRERIQTALIYPACVIGMSLLIMLFMLGVMMPRFARMFAEARLAIPAFTRYTFAAGRLLGILLLLLPPLILLALFLHRTLAQRRQDWRARTDRILLALPLIGRARLALINMRFSQTLALVLQSGMPLTDGLELAARATASPWTEQLMQTQREHVKHGATLASALRAIPPLAGALPAWVQAGEHSGELANMLDEAAQRYRQQWDRLVSRFLAILEPALILAIGLSVLIVALAILLPILSLNEAIGG